MARYVLEVMYDGTKFHGSQIQGDVPTVQLAINNALSILFRRQVISFGASRTDEGVHALCNYFHFDEDGELTFDLLYKMNSILPESLAVKKIFKAANHEFNARFDAISRTYRYRIYFKKDPFLLNRAMYYPLKIDKGILNDTAEVIKQYTSFESFAKRNKQSKSFECTISASYWEDMGSELNYVVTANRFLRGMVRGLVATQLHVARGSINIDDLTTIIMSKDCRNAYFDVPGHGLYLEQINYKEDSLLLY